MHIFSVQRLQENCGALLRLYFCTNIILTNLLGFFDHKSLSYQLTSHAGMTGLLVLDLMTALAIFGLVDTFINDVLPDRYTAYHGLESRHLIFMGLALCYAAHMWFGVAIKSYMIIPYCSLQIIFISVAAFLDVHNRYSPTGKVRMRQLLPAEGSAHAA